MSAQYSPPSELDICKFTTNIHELAPDICTSAQHSRPTIHHILTENKPRIRAILNSAITMRKSYEPMIMIHAFNSLIAKDRGEPAPINRHGHTIAQLDAYIAALEKIEIADLNNHPSILTEKNGCARL